MANAFAPHVPSAEERASTEPGTTKQAPHLVRRHALAKLVRADGTIDWSPWYLTEEEDVGQSGEQGQISDMLRSSLRVLVEERGWSSVLVAADNFFAWVESEPLVQVSPDIYLVDLPDRSRPAAGPNSQTSGTNGGTNGGTTDGTDEAGAPSRSIISRMLDLSLPRRWESWRPDHLPPRLAIEIVSTDWKKDYEINPDRYDHLGVRELVLVDPKAFIRDLSRAGRAPLLIYRRNAQDRLELAYRGHGPARCAEIAAYLCFQTGLDGKPRVRLSRDAAGTDIVCTNWERAVVETQKAVAAEQRAAAAEQNAAAAVQNAAVAVQNAAVAEQNAAAAVQNAAAAEQRMAAAEQEVAAAEQKVAAQAAEIAALRARLRDLERE